MARFPKDSAARRSRARANPAVAHALILVALAWATVSLARQYGLYASCSDTECHSCQNNTLYINRCVYQPEINSCLMNTCNGTDLYQLLYENSAECVGSPQVTTIPLRTCLEGPFDNSLQYYCGDKPFVPPPAPLYGQVVTCPPGGGCNSIACDYNWFVPGACVPGPFGSTLNTCNATTYITSSYGSEDCSGAAQSTVTHPLFTCIPVPNFPSVEYQCAKSPLPPPGTTTMP